MTNEVTTIVWITNTDERAKHHKAKKMPVDIASLFVEKIKPISIPLRLLKDD